MKRALGTVMTALLFACGGEAPPVERIEQRWPPPADVDTQPQGQAGLVRATLVASDCPDQVPGETTWTGLVHVDGDTIQVTVDSMPVLTGRIEDGRAKIEGVTTFWNVEEVTCSVAGVAKVGAALVTAQVTETLSSQSTLNCAQDWSLELPR
jgi:hypothetical protein